MIILCRISIDQLFGEEMAEKAANLGYFVSKDQPNKNADNVCVLVVHYNFENTNDESWIREGDAEDVENLKNTYKVNRKCNFHDELSPEKGKLLKLLSNQEELLEKFGCTDVPSVFVLYILSHGDSDGKIFTDNYQNEDPNDFICFTTTEIFESLKMLTGFEDCLKLINFGPCRGELIDAIFYENDENFKNENSCRITYSPLMRNTVVFYSTVETTKAKRDQKGTTFAFLTCHVLNSLEEDESLINVLTTIQYESHKVAVKEKTGQTPEVKMFSQDRNFVFSRSSSNDSSSSKIEAKSVKIKRKHEFYSWKSSSGENLRHRLAFLISAKPNNKQFKEIKRELSQNLDFETSERMLRGNPLASINKASRLDSDIGCVLLVFFGLVSENEDTSEVCVEVDGRDTAISEILHEFIGPKNDQWIGKPKILFLVNQETSSFDAIKSTQKPKITATNHSGWLVLVLHNKGELQKLIELFNGQELKKKRSLQELLANLLISESSEKCENRDMLNSTLQYLLNFPDCPSTDSQLAKEKTKSGETGLHILLKLSKYHSVEKVCFLVEEIGVDARAKDKNGFTALLIAYNEGKECVDYLMTKDINLDVKNKRGQTCLHVAAENDDLDALQTWIELGGDLDSVDNGGLTALHIAAESGHLQFVKKLLASKPEATEAQNLDVSESSSGSSLVKYERVNRCDNEGRTALHLAAKSENVDLVKWLLENNADLTLTDMKGNNAIHYAIENERMLRFINEKNGHLVNQRLKDGNTTLHLMIQCFCSKEVVAWILEQGDIDINAKNDLGDTPLLMACKELFSNVAELLLTRNVDVNVPDTRGKTAMHYAAERGKLGLVQKMYKKGEKMSEVPANLGYFVSEDQTIQNANNVCVLVVHYNFENAKQKYLFRKGDAEDVKNLERTYSENRKCNFHDELSPEKGKLLKLLSDQKEILQLFGCSGVPSVFVLYILSHGHRDGIIFTDHYKNDNRVEEQRASRSDGCLDPKDLFISFKITEIFDSLKKLTGFEDCLKFINFGPCRGELKDAVYFENQKNIPFKNENSCRITYSPEMRNTVVFFSTVETTLANRDQSGTTFARHICMVLDSLKKDESLMNVVTTIQHESHKVAVKEITGQTPEVKMFSQGRSFMFSKSPSASSMIDAQGIQNEKNVDYYPWEIFPRRLAFLFSAEQNDQLKEIKSALSQNLHFETSEMKLNENFGEYINKVSRKGSNIGCIFLILFGHVSENDETNEVCVQVDSKKTAVSEILRELIGPKNEQWIGKPKILFVVNQESGSFDAKGINQPKMATSATNHSGWLVFVSHGKDTLQKLIKIFKGQELKKNKSLQELLASLLISESKENRDLLNSTLQYLLKFPDPFVRVTFSLTMPDKTREDQVSFDSLVKKAAAKNQIWLLSSVDGTGKTTILREIDFQLGKLDPDIKILHISLPKVQFIGQKKNVVDEIEFLAENTGNSREEITNSIENRQCVALLDGYDEIQPENHKKVLKVIEALEKRQLSVWIATRPHAADAIQKLTSNAILVKIDPLNQEQQIELLQLKTGMSPDECVQFIAKFPSKEILENPLDLTFVAESNVEGNLYQIYDQIVRHKVKLSLLRNGYDKNNKVKFQEELDLALERLQEIASCHIKGDEIDDDSREELENMNCYGVATFENNKVLFIRQNFAEFLAAQYFLQKIKDSGECIEEAANVFFGQSFPRCKKFVDLFCTGEEMAEQAANLGYFVSKDQPNKNADNVCVLVVHYNFENTNDESWIREGDAEDVENLKNTYKVNRKCNFHDELSPEKGKLLKLLSNQEELLEKFGCTDVPSVFVLYILSHGDSDGKIFTDHYQNEDPNDFICFTTTEIFESLKMLTGFEDCLKLINFGPCRGELIDAIFYEKDENFKNENSCRITYSPMMRNTVVFYSTVETTKAKRDQKGSTFARLTCQVLDSIEMDKSLIYVLTTIQNESHKEAVRENTGQTPEVKMFSQDRSFFFSKSSNDSFPSETIKIKTEREFYSWKSSSGENLRHRLAILLSSGTNEQLKEFKIALSQNLNFETYERKLSGKPWTSINEASRIDSDIGCIFLIIFGLLSEREVSNEVCVQVDGQETAVSEIISEFIGPKNEQWIGKPKVLFLVNHKTSSFDFIGPEKPKMEISATNHSGWLVLVVHGEETLEKLIEIFKGEELKKEKSLQELLASLLISNSIENRDLLNLTLQYLLNFPDWPSDHRVDVIRFLHSIDSQLSKDKTKTGLTGLHILVASCKNPLDGRVRFLVEEIGVDARAKDNQGRTALRIAVNGGKDCVNYLMTKDINLQVKNNRGQTCLHVAALRGDLDALQSWIDLGGDLDVEDLRGLTALHIAACRGHLQFVKKLLACTAEADAKKQSFVECSSGSSMVRNERVNRCDNFGRTALHFATSSGNVDLVMLLLENKANLSLTDFEGKNAIHYAINNEGMVKFINEQDRDLLKKCSENGNTTLHLALQFDNAIDHNIIQWIVEQVDDTVLNAINASGDSPLLLACRSMFWGVAELLLTRDVEVNVSDTEGKTAMHYAARDGNLDLVKLMHENGANFTLTDSKGMNALHHAMGYFENIHMLLIWCKCYGREAQI
ncbi:Hypothetical predicted protein [Cloeon dipterum]|uniref:Peptidase C14 caspase domain-containing protein n=1 Tax=Cloeon dipterum TaxID=197152 RepID=A0A8S1DZJ2_9INSE|nr:Hypothetical predicted protein [Cloeon dipterum]